MRGDFEILAYNVIHWAGGELPWVKNKLLALPAKVQQSKEDLMSGLDAGLKSCFSNQQIPGKVFFFHFLRSFCLFLANIFRLFFFGHRTNCCIP